MSIYLYIYQYISLLLKVFALWTINNRMLSEYCITGACVLPMIQTICVLK